MALEFISIISLMIAIVLIWCPWQSAWIPPASVFLVFALISGWIKPLALVWIVILCIVVWYHDNARSSFARKLSLALLALTALAFATHQLPGFTTIQWWADTRLSEHSGWSALRFTADKPLVALCLLLSYRSTLCRTGLAFKKALSSTAGAMIPGIASVYLLGLLIGYVVIDLSFSPLVLIWFIRNLLFTVIAEELFFRTVLQSRLESAISGRYAGLAAISVIAICFGVVHLYAGLIYGLLAALASCVYGYVYYRSGRVEMAILAHALLNLGHLVLLSYPDAHAYSVA